MFRPTSLSVSLSVMTISMAACDSRSPSRMIEAEPLAAACAIETSVLATLGRPEDPMSLQTNLSLWVEVESLTSGGWLMTAGVPFFETPIQYASNGDLVGEVGRAGLGPNEFVGPWGLARGPGDSIWVSNSNRTVVVLDPAGWPSRTFAPDSSRALVEGFTPSGRPYGAWGRNSTVTDAYYPFLRIYDLDGGAATLLGPGSHDPAANWYPLGLARGRVVATSDSTALAAYGDAEGKTTTNDPVWISEWRPGVENDLVMKSEIVAQLQESIGSIAPHQLQHVAFRVLPDGKVVSLAALGEYPVGETESPQYFLVEAAAANQHYDGLIMLLDGKTVLGVARIPDAIVGFSSDNQVFSVLEDPSTGLVSARVWEFGFERCDVAESTD